MKHFSIAACALFCLMSSAAMAGGVKGVIKIKGEIPKPVVKFEKGANIKNAAVCAANQLFDNTLEIDQDTGGIGHVFIYMKSAPKGAKFDAPEKKELLFDQVGCRFYPHAMIVRPQQTVEVISSDPIAHNFHTYPIRNNPINVLMAPNTPKGEGVEVKFGGAEPLPMKVGCDIHSWMQAWWLVIDHPFCAVTDARGHFEIDGLPEGEHEFRVWQERAGYLEKKLTVKVKDGKVTDLGEMEYPLETFEE